MGNHGVAAFPALTPSAALEESQRGQAGGVGLGRRGARSSAGGVAHDDRGQGDAHRPGPAAGAPEEPLKQAFDELSRRNIEQLPVLYDGKVVGMLHRNAPEERCRALARVRLGAAQDDMSDLAEGGTHRASSTPSANRPFDPRAVARAGRSSEPAAGDEHG